MNRKANAVVLILFAVLMFSLIIYFTKYSAPRSVQHDATLEAATESSTAVRKAVYVGVGQSMENGLSNDSRWFCNRPLPPSYTEANISLADNTNGLLARYFAGLRTRGYQNSHDNMTYDIAFPLEAVSTVKVPGYSVVITDLSGSMSFTLGGIRKDMLVQQMNQILIEAAFNKTPGAKIGLITYNDDAIVANGLSDDIVPLAAAVRRMNAPQSGGTCIACGIYRATELLVPPPPPEQPPTERPLSIVLMSDGGANTCFDQDTVLPECLVLDFDVGGAGCSRAQAQQQAIEYARQAHELYGIEFYTVIFDTDFCPQGVDPLDCYDPDTMQEIACAGGNCSNFYIGDDQQSLEEIYRRYGEAVARFIIRDFTYLKLENDRIFAHGKNITAGVDSEDLKTLQDISDSHLWNFRTWYMYKNLVNFLLHGGGGLLESEYMGYLSGKLPCKAVFHGAECPPPGTPYAEFNETFNRMMLTPEDLGPIEFLKDFERELRNFLNQTNISCTAEYTKYGLANIPVFDFRSERPQQVPLNAPFGNGSLRHSSLDGQNPRLECPEREDFLGLQPRHPLGIVGANAQANPFCTPGQPYQYLGVDRTLEFDINVRCTDLEAGAVMDGRSNFIPLTLEFIISVDIMSDCQPPDDVTHDMVVC